MSGRHSLLIRAVRPLSALTLVLVALGLFYPGSCKAGDATRRHQVWALIHVVDREKSRETVDIQVPLEWLQKGDHLTTCENDSKGIDGRELYRKYKDLPPGEEKTVETLDCHDSEVVVRVANRDVESGPRARSLHITVRSRDKDDDEDGDVDITVPFSALGSLGNLLKGNWLSFEDSDDEQAEREQRELADEAPGFAELLRQLPPFRIVEVHGDDGGTVVVRSE